MKLLGKILLLAAAGFALAAVQRGESLADPTAQVAPSIEWSQLSSPESFVPRCGSWANVFSAGWR
jgi:hypothetical protein